MIYRDWKHYWREGKHGFSSASKEYAKEIWDDLEPTILASRDDYKNAYVQLMNDHTERRVDVTDSLLKYAELFCTPDAPKFWRWYYDTKMSEVTSVRETSV